ncbi:hypothetical protein A7A08_01030 [Methyloligella halotolerans]|uniref:YeeE/YedE family protein n=1 Tax=Methyloligella halotolerans TaxID=1177755 RepID=A0A1E2S048_9HYPH|nr:YeeE/YedE family protein [Methyloligella halotolerans]ODA67863.1 hypothetical protein A7A08_01030 [Methyloligella halotolerans]
MAGLRLLSALILGAVFGFGLAISGMLDPARVRGFLDIAGNWDPSLGFVLAGAVLVAGLGRLVQTRLSHPLLSDRFHLPEKTQIDARLITGAAIFGIGWGMAGLCPGPAVADLMLGAPAVLVFVPAMIVGMLLHDRLAADGTC